MKALSSNVLFKAIHGHLAYMTRKGLRTLSTSPSAKSTFSCLLFGICLLMDGHPTPSVIEWGRMPPSAWYMWLGILRVSLLLCPCRLFIVLVCKIRLMSFKTGSLLLSSAALIMVKLSVINHRSSRGKWCQRNSQCFSVACTGLCVRLRPTSSEHMKNGDFMVEVDSVHTLDRFTSSSAAWTF